MGLAAGVVWAIILAGIDTCFRRLPDVLTLPAILVVWGWAAVAEPWWILGGVIWACTYFLMSGFGGGDIKLAASLGVLAAAHGVLGWCAAVGGASIITMMAGMLTRSPTVAHGPGMLAATFAVCLL